MSVCGGQQAWWAVRNEKIRRFVVLSEQVEWSINDGALFMDEEFCGCLRVDERNG